MHGSEKFAHQHVEPTITAECGDLTRTIERLNAVGLAKRGANGVIVERADDPLLAALADPVPDQSVLSPVAAPRCSKFPGGKISLCPDSASPGRSSIKRQDRRKRGNPRQAAP
jgi:hypothetical protein